MVQAHKIQNKILCATLLERAYNFKILRKQQQNQRQHILNILF